MDRINRDRSDSINSWSEMVYYTWIYSWCFSRSMAWGKSGIANNLIARITWIYSWCFSRSMAWGKSGIANNLIARIAWIYTWCFPRRNTRYKSFWELNGIDGPFISFSFRIIWWCRPKKVLHRGEKCSKQ